MRGGGVTRALIGGVGYRWSRDASFGLVVADELAKEQWQDTVSVADLGYGALYVALDLIDWRPPLDRLVLVAGVSRGREPGRLYVRRWEPPVIPPDDLEVQARICEAGGGVIDIDHLLVIANRFGGLPGEVTCVELEPVDTNGGDGMSEAAERRVRDACALTRSLALDEALV